MKKTLIFAGALSLILMTSCSDGAVSENSAVNESSSASQEVSSGNGEQQETDGEVIKQEEMCMPVMYVRTVSQGPDALKFLTEPVNRFVSEQIASWTPGYTIPPAPFYEACTVELRDTDNSVILAEAEAEVKVRGNWTTSYPKKPLRIKFKEKQSLAGLNNGSEFKNWVMFAEYKDASMLRNRTALGMSREILGPDGLYASDSQPVELVVNGQYQGVYVLAEMQQINSSRINITEPKADDTSLQTGYLLELDGNFENEDELHSLSVDFCKNAPLVPFNGDQKSVKKIRCLPENPYEPKKMVGMIVKSNVNTKEQHDFINSYVNNVYNLMYAAAYEQKAYEFTPDFTEIKESASLTPEEAVRKAVDVQSLADMYIISELTCDADIYWSSFYMDVDFSSSTRNRLTFEAPWDFDSALGNKNRCADGKGFYAASIVPDVNGYEYETINPWLAVLMGEEWFCDIIREKWTAVYDSGALQKVISEAENDKTKYRAAFERNYAKWNNIINNDDFADELSQGAANCRNEEEAADYMISWLRARTEFMNSYWHK